MVQKLNDLTIWYKKNTAKILLLFIVIVVFTLTITFIPYLNILIFPAAGIGFSFIIWYILFLPGTRVLVTLGLGILFITLSFSLIRMNSIADAIGDIFYLILVFIFFNNLRELFKEKRSK